MKNIILLPTYNERENVKIIIPEIFKLIPEIFILVIDDNSPDNTVAAVKDLMKEYEHLSILKRREKTGLGDAYSEAIKKVCQDENVDLVITMDADGSHSPEYLKNFLTAASDHDLVIGSRYIKGGGVEKWEFWRRTLSRLGNLYVKILTGLKIHDFTAGFMCIKRELLEKIDFNKISSSGYSFLLELKFYLIKKLQARTKEIPIIFRSRREGESKISNQIISEGIRTPWRLLIKRIWLKE